MQFGMKQLAGISHSLFKCRKRYQGWRQGIVECGISLLPRDLMDLMCGIAIEPMDDGDQSLPMG